MKFAHSFLAIAVAGGAAACDSSSPEIPPLLPAPELIASQQCDAEAEELAFTSRLIDVAGTVVGPIGAMVENPRIVFIDENTGATTYVALADSQEFTASIAPSRYSVAVAPDYIGYQNPVSNLRLLDTGVEIPQPTGRLRFEVKLAHHSIDLTFGGDAFPASDDRGVIRIESLTTSEVFLRPVPVDGATRLDIALPADSSYQVSWSKVASGATVDFVDDRSVIPYGKTSVGSIAAVPNFESLLELPDVTHTFDVPSESVRIDGTVLLEDRPFPPNDIDARRGLLTITDVAVLDLPRTGDVAYSIPVVPGAYASSVLLFDYETAGQHAQYGLIDLCTDPSARCDDGLCAFDIDQQWSPSIRPFDAPPASALSALVMRETTYRCAVALPVAGGTLTFVNNETLGRKNITIDSAGVAATEELPHGTYTVTYSSNQFNSGEPRGAAVLDTAFFFDGTQAPEWTFFASAASVEVMINGENMLDDTELDGESRGELLVRKIDADGEPLSGLFSVGDFGEIGQAFSSFEIADGAYEFWISNVVPEGKGSFRYSNQSALPHGIRQIGTHTFEGADMDFVVFDLQVSDIDISVAIDNESLATEFLGSVTFEDDVGSVIGTRYEPELTVRLYSGAYSAIHRPEMADAYAPALNGFTYGSAIYMGTFCVMADAEQ